ncbi:MAG: response regulator [Bacteroidota bacterium]|nr:response regulator [Bacteroidota bacterium]
MHPCKILIVEDESLVAMDMIDMLTRQGYEMMPYAMGYTEAISLLEKETPDIILIDINLSGHKTGIQLAHLIAEQYQIPFIFTTSHSDRQTVTEAAATMPSGYLLKPFNGEDLFTSIEVALANFANRACLPVAISSGLLINESIFVKTEKNFIKVKVDEILWLEADHNYLNIILDNGKHMIRSSFQEIMQRLPKEQFIQIHKSYIINSKCIDSFSHTEVVIQQKTLPLSRNYKDNFIAKINRVH